MTNEHPETVIQRHATTLSEVRRMHDEYRVMQDELAHCRRTIDQQTNMIELLKNQLDKSQNEGAIYHRKLIRLAEAMSMMHQLSAKAHEIMLSTQEWDEQEAERAKHEAQPQSEQHSAAEIVALIRDAGRPKDNGGQQ